MDKVPYTQRRRASRRRAREERGVRREGGVTFGGEWLVCPGVVHSSFCRPRAGDFPHFTPSLSFTPSLEASSSTASCGASPILLVAPSFPFPSADLAIDLLAKVYPIDHRGTQEGRPTLASLLLLANCFHLPSTERIAGLPSSFVHASQESHLFQTTTLDLLTLAPDRHRGTRPFGLYHRSIKPTPPTTSIEAVRRLACRLPFRPLSNPFYFSSHLISHADPRIPQEKADEGLAKRLKRSHFSNVASGRLSRHLYFNRRLSGLDSSCLVTDLESFSKRLYQAEQFSS